MWKKKAWHGEKFDSQDPMERNWMMKTNLPNVRYMYSHGCSFNLIAPGTRRFTGYPPHLSSSAAASKVFTGYPPPPLRPGCCCIGPQRGVQTKMVGSPPQNGGGVTPPPHPPWTPAAASGWGGVKLLHVFSGVFGRLLLQKLGGVNLGSARGYLLMWHSPDGDSEMTILN